MFKERLKGKYFDVKEDTYVRKCAKIEIEHQMDFIYHIDELFK